jgi:hypothetical protein
MGDQPRPRSAKTERNVRWAERRHLPPADKAALKKVDNERRRAARAATPAPAVHVPGAKSPGRQCVGTADAFTLAVRKHVTKFTDRQMRTAHGGVGVRENAVKAITRRWEEDVPHTTTATGCFLDIGAAMNKLCGLLARDRQFAPSTGPMNLLVFIDSNQQYAARQSTVLTLQLCGTYRPHSEMCTLPIARWLGKLTAGRLRTALDHADLAPFLARCYGKRLGATGQMIRVVIYPDWPQWLMLLGQGNANVCPGCYCARKHWLDPVDTEEEYHPRPLSGWAPLFRDVLAAVRSPLDMGHDPLHNVALVLSHMLFHGLWFWFKGHPAAAQRLPALEHHFRKHTRPVRFRGAQAVRVGRAAPEDEAPRDRRARAPKRARGVPPKRARGVPRDRARQPLPPARASSKPKADVSLKRPDGQTGGRSREWRCSNKAAKDVLSNDVFWAGLEGIWARTGVVVRDEHGAAMALAPQRYLRGLRRLCQQLLHWNPTGVARRTEECNAVKALYLALHMPRERVTVQCHFFLDDYAPRLVRHGNLVALNTEGGEHTHQVHNSVSAQRPSCPHDKCPVGVDEGIRGGARTLGCWAEGGLRAPARHAHAMRMPVASPQKKATP